MIAVILSDSAHFGRDFLCFKNSLAEAEQYLREEHLCNDDECWMDIEIGQAYYCDDWGYRIYESRPEGFKEGLE